MRVINILQQAGDVARKRWRGSPLWGKILLTILLIILAGIVLACILLWALGKVIKGMTSSMSASRDFYIPRMRRR